MSRVEPIPVRLDMPPEIAAVALPHKRAEAPIVILNANEESQRTAFSLLRDALVPAAIAWITGWAAQWIKDHHVAATTIAATTVSVAVATGVNVALDGDNTPAALPQQTITIFASPSQATTSPLPTRIIVTPKPSKVATARADPTEPPAILADEPEPTRQSTSSPTGRATPQPTVRPTVRSTATRSTPSSEPTPPPARDTPQAQPSAVPTPSPGQPSSTPPPTAEPLATTAAAGCAIRVDLDPLLNLCVLG